MKRSNSYFGDNGTMLPEQARDEIDKNAQSDADEYTEQAERIARDPVFKYLFADPEKRREFVEQLAEELRGENGERKPVQPQEPKDEPILSRAADDKFWNSDEPKKYTTKKL